MKSDIGDSKAKELAKISEILYYNSSIYGLALQDFGVSNSSTGAKGMTAEQVIRAAIIKQIRGGSYQELAFHFAIVEDTLRSVERQSFSTELFSSTG